jgi:hypothetical protein
LLDGHERAFRWFGGVTLTCLYDNPRNLVLGRREHQALWHPQFADSRAITASRRGPVSPIGHGPRVGDFDIQKRPTSILRNGPLPRVDQVHHPAERAGGWQRWSGERRWSYLNGFAASTSLEQARSTEWHAS